MPSQGDDLKVPLHVRAEGVADNFVETTSSLPPEVSAKLTPEHIGLLIDAHKEETERNKHELALKEIDSRKGSEIEPLKQFLLPIGTGITGWIAGKAQERLKK